MASRIRSIIFLFSLILALFLFFHSHAGVGDSIAPMNASLQPYFFYYITISEKLSEGILFTNETGAEENIQYPLISGSQDNNAVWNYNKSNKKTAYWIFFSGNVQIDLCHGAENHLCSNPNCTGEDNIQIDISNAKWSSSLTNDATSPSSSSKVPFVIGYDDTNKIITNLQSDTYVYLRYFLDIPSNTPAVPYNTTYQIRAVLAGESCA